MMFEVAVCHADRKPPPPPETDGASSPTSGRCLSSNPASRAMAKLSSRHKMNWFLQTRDPTRRKMFGGMGQTKCDRKNLRGGRLDTSAISSARFVNRFCQSASESSRPGGRLGIDPCRRCIWVCTVDTFQSRKLRGCYGMSGPGYLKGVWPGFWGAFWRSGRSWGPRKTS